jgi:hypothetical protein
MAGASQKTYGKGHRLQRLWFTRLNASALCRLFFRILWSCRCRANLWNFWIAGMGIGICETRISWYLLHMWDGRMHGHISNEPALELHPLAVLSTPTSFSRMIIVNMQPRSEKLANTQHPAPSTAHCTPNCTVHGQVQRILKGSAVPAGTSTPSTHRIDINSDIYSQAHAVFGPKFVCVATSTRTNPKKAGTSPGHAP